MNTTDLRNSSLSATKWSAFTQIAVKIVSPITNMILARILAPEAFGVVVTVTIITSFVEMFSDAGFQKYLVQKEFINEEQKYKSANVAFLTNFVVSILLWAIIIVFSSDIALLVGSPGLGNVIAIACIQLPLTALSSIQLALYQRDFNFKTIFMVRIITVLVPFIVTIPLAVLSFGYWSLIIGNIAMQLLNAIILTVKSNWKPNLFYSTSILKEMFSFSIWTMFESVSIWLTTWIDAFIVSSLLSQHSLGIYKTSTTMVNALFSVITATVVPVLFSTLSRLQNDNEKFASTYLRVQRYVAFIIFPLGIGVYLFSDLVTLILLGEKWLESSEVIAVWALTSSIMIVLGHFSSEAYRAKGKPKLSLIGQVLHLVVLVPACYISIKYGFLVFVHVRSWIRIQFVAVHLILMQKYIGISAFLTLKNVITAIIATIVMGLFGFFVRDLFSGLIWGILSIIACVFIYLIILILFKSSREDLFRLYRIFNGKLMNKLTSNK